MKKEAAAVFPHNAGAVPTISHPGCVLPLNLVHTGQKVCVRSITGKDETKRFLGNIGFVEGAEVSVVTEMNGNVIVNIKGARVAISKSMASRVLTA